MKYQFTGHENIQHLFRDLEKGNIFICSKETHTDLYIKINQIESKNAIKLSDGTLISISPTTEVKVYSAPVIFERSKFI